MKAFKFNSLDGRSRHASVLSIITVIALALSLVCSVLQVPATKASAGGDAADKLDLNKTAVPDFNVNLGKHALKPPTAAQLNALASLKQSLNDSSVTARWDKTSGSVDSVMDFASAPSSLEPEAAARSFVESNAALFGIDDAGTLKLKSNVQALGGNLLYFEQVHAGLPVASGGVGVVMDGERRVRAVSGPY